MARLSVAKTPADPVVEYVPLEIDGETYRLAWDFNAIAEAEQIINAGIPDPRYQVNLLQGVARVLISAPTASQLRGLLYAAMRMAQPKITIEKAGALVRIDTTQDIVNGLARAYNASCPDGKKILADPIDGGGEPPAET